MSLQEVGRKGAGGAEGGSGLPPSLARDLGIFCSCPRDSLLSPPPFAQFPLVVSDGCSCLAGLGPREPEGCGAPWNPGTEPSFSGGGQGKGVGSGSSSGVHWAAEEWRGSEGPSEQEMDQEERGVSAPSQLDQSPPRAEQDQEHQSTHRHRPCPAPLPVHKVPSLGFPPR